MTKHKTEDYKARPNYLSRSNNLSGNLEELPKPKFTHSAMSNPC